MKLRKFVKGAAALGIMTAMLGSVSLTAGAADINITNSVKDKTYTAYKVFDATYGDGDTAAYTANSTVHDALKSYTDLFEFTEQGNTGTYNVTIKDETKKSEMISAFTAVPL